MPQYANQNNNCQLTSGYYYTLQPWVTSSLDCWLQRYWWHGDLQSVSSFLKLCSNSNNCPMKFKFGDIMGRTAFTILYASIIDNCLYFIMYAIAIVALRDTPAWQWTKTLAPFFLAASANRITKHSQRYKNVAIT